MKIFVFGFVLLILSACDNSKSDIAKHIYNTCTGITEVTYTIGGLGGTASIKCIETADKRKKKE